MIKSFYKVGGFLSTISIWVGPCSCGYAALYLSGALHIVLRDWGLRSNMSYYTVLSLVSLTIPSTHVYLHVGVEQSHMLDWLSMGTG